MKPKIVTARIKNTGWPIDGKEVYLSQYDWHAPSWHLYAWQKDDDEAIMRTIWESLTEAGAELHNSFEDFAADWKAEKECTDMTFNLCEDQVEIIEVKQEAEPEDEDEKKQVSKGGVMLLPLEKNMKKAKANHPEWELVKCPECGQNCYSFPEARRMQLTQGTRLICTECGIKAGIVKSYTAKNMPHPDGNRATRRAKKKAARRKS